jgi:hypothetical protein
MPSHIHPGRHNGGLEGSGRQNSPATDTAVGAAESAKSAATAPSGRDGRSEKASGSYAPGAGRDAAPARIRPEQASLGAATPSLVPPTEPGEPTFVARPKVSGFVRTELVPPGPLAAARRRAAPHDTSVAPKHKELVTSRTRRRAAAAAPGALLSRGEILVLIVAATLGAAIVLGSYLHATHVPLEGARTILTDRP